MKTIVLVCYSCLLPLFMLQAQTSVDIEIPFQELDQAFVAKDTASLSLLLHDKLTLGHSNGWLETKPDLLQTLATGGVLYSKIKQLSQPKLFYQNDTTITSRREISVSGKVKDHPFTVRLNILEIWLWNGNRWQLLARQSVGIDQDN